MARRIAASPAQGDAGADEQGVSHGPQDQWAYKTVGQKHQLLAWRRRATPNQVAATGAQLQNRALRRSWSNSRLVQMASSNRAVTGATNHLLCVVAPAALNKSSALATVNEPPIGNANVRSVERRRALRRRPHLLSHSPHRTKSASAEPAASALHSWETGFLDIANCQRTEFVVALKDGETAGTQHGNMASRGADIHGPAREPLGSRRINRPVLCAQ